MQVREGGNRISWSDSREKPSQDEPKETTRHSGLARSQNTNQCMMIPRFYWLLPLLHAKLFLHSPATTRPYEENHPLALGGTTIQGI